MTVDTQKLRELLAKATPGPWRWEFNAEYRNVHLVGGKPQYDLTIMDFTRWGMNGAGIRLRDLAHDDLNLMHKLHDRPDWIGTFPGREHHKRWCAAVVHPDMQLMTDAVTALPALLDEIDRLRAELQARQWQPIETAPHLQSVLVHYQNDLGKGRTVKAKYVPRFAVEQPESEDCEEYDEDNDRYTLLPGWYEQIDNWGDFSQVFMHNAPVKWMPLPPAPTQGETS